MTTLVAWMALNAGGSKAVYLASDSRITWGSSGRWDAGRKLFACRTSPDIFGFCGDVLFASQVLGQVADLVDHGLLYHPGARTERRHGAVSAAVHASHARRHNTRDDSFQIIHVSRQGEGVNADFRVWVISYSARNRAWQDQEIEFSRSAPLAFGSGGPKFSERMWGRPTASERDANRAAFSTFCACLAEEVDLASGGVPQLVGLYADRPAQTFGIVHDGVRYLHGLPAGTIHRGRLEWRDSDFQAIDGRTLQLKRLVRRRDRARSVQARPRRSST